MERRQAEQRAVLWFEETKMPQHGSIAPLISTGNSSLEIARTHLCAMLAGYPVPLQLATAGFDQTRKNWFIRAMKEVGSDQWPGFSGRELETLWNRHRRLRTNVEAADEAWTQAWGRK